MLEEAVVAVGGAGLDIERLLEKLEPAEEPEGFEEAFE